MKRAFSRVVLILLAGFSSSVYAVDLKIDNEKSAFIAVTQKSGMLASLGHDHIIQASKFSGRLMVSEQGDINHLNIVVEVQDLAVASKEFNDKWFRALIKKYKILSERPEDLDAADNQKIRANMLSDQQLAGGTHKQIRGLFIDSKKMPIQNAYGTFNYQVKMSLTIKGKPLLRRCFASLTSDGKGHISDFLCELKFSDFDIEPFSAFLGTMGNKDVFHLLAHIEANEEK